jgi:cytosine/adenosine deaminase-related metal-dependent hydrolase
MQYRKFSADKLFDGYTLREDRLVLITTRNGTIEKIVPFSEAGDDVNYLPGIISPGFINCHCHLELSHMKNNIPEKTGLVSFVSQVIKNRHIPEQEIMTAIEKAEDEMLENGIVAVGDICNNTITIAQKRKGRLRYHNFIEASGFQPQLAEQRFQRALAIFNEYAAYSSTNSIVPHAPYSVADELWEKIIHFHGSELLTIHNQETPAEDELFLAKKGEMLKLYEALGIDISYYQPSGKSSLQTYLPKFSNNQQVILVHNVNTTQNDLDNLKFEISNLKLYWCLCPNANLYIGGKLPDVEMLAREKGELVLGTDSLASNHQLSILAEMQTIARHFPSVSLEQLLRWATINGAKALQMDSILGSFEPGKQPGVLLIDNDLSGSSRLI